LRRSEREGPAWWMNGTSESRWRRKISSAAAILSPTRSRKRAGDSGGAEVARSVLSAKSGLLMAAGGLEGLDRVEADHLLELPALEAVHPTAFEVPPGGLVVIRVGGPPDLVGVPHLVVDLALVRALQRGHELPHLVDVGGVLDHQRLDDRFPRIDPLGDVLALEHLHLVLPALAHRDPHRQREAVVVVVAVS